ncbi:response regulator [Cellulophaga sp. HaHaR_3_176]|uniref:response regulator n=1 Tax=Cellulophaga sp. HaHaR_3_176 TaxID=1942464 RepID=UPI001C1F29D4|nr:response regulator [Cellulophaga sp. HaHaR_3_176]QWX85130.1 response regulator [Cellulophaga sp. HaHaR_3_176]
MEVKSILLVDDDESTNFINSVFIKKLDIDVDVYITLDGAEALELIDTSKDEEDFFPCLIILDINMPGMNGWAFLDNYKNLPASIKDNCVVVMTTVSEDEKDLIRANNNNDVKEYFQKPMSDEKFSTLIYKYFM